MIESLYNFFSTQGFMPHGICLLWKPSILWLTVFSHIIITVSYFVIPLALIYFIFRRKDLKFKWIFALFGAFILFCGLTHLIALITLWKPIYGLQAIILLATAIVSCLTAILIWPQIPALLKIPSTTSLEEKNIALQRINNELTAAEAQSRSILEAAPDAIIMVDENGNITLANTEVENLFGYTQNQLIGKKIELLIPMRFKQAHPKFRKKYFTQPRRRPMGDNLDLFALHKDGFEFPVEISLSPVKIKNQIVGLAAIRDLSDKKRTEEKLKYLKELENLNNELQTQKNALLRSNEELDNFCYIASHDLREPLRGIHNYAQFILEDYADKLDESGKQMLSALPQLSKKLDELICSLLEYSRLGRVELAYMETDLKSVVDEVVASLAASIKLNNVTIKIQASLPVIYCDKIRVTEVFQNLITNAIKYNDNQEKYIEVGVDQAKKAIYVKDNGIGIDNKYKEEVFKIFKRLHPQNKYNGGTGSGLTIVRKIVERHGGKIWVDSRVEEGSCFYFNLGDEQQGKS